MERTVDRANLSGRAPINHRHNNKRAPRTTLRVTLPLMETPAQGATVVNHGARSHGAAVNPKARGLRMLQGVCVPICALPPMGCARKFFFLAYVCVRWFPHVWSLLFSSITEAQYKVARFFFLRWFHPYWLRRAARGKGLRASSFSCSPVVAERPNLGCFSISGDAYDYCRYDSTPFLFRYFLKSHILMLCCCSGSFGIQSLTSTAALCLCFNPVNIFFLNLPLPKHYNIFTHDRRCFLPPCLVVFFVCASCRV